MKRSIEQEKRIVDKLLYETEGGVGLTYDDMIKQRSESPLLSIGTIVIKCPLGVVVKEVDGKNRVRFTTYFVPALDNDDDLILRDTEPMFHNIKNRVLIGLYELLDREDTEAIYNKDLNKELALQILGIEEKTEKKEDVHDMFEVTEDCHVFFLEMGVQGYLTKGTKLPIEVTGSIITSPTEEGMIEGVEFHEKRFEEEMDEIVRDLFGDLKNGL